VLDSIMDQMRIKAAFTAIHAIEGHHLQIRALMASDEWESKCQDAVLLALGAAA
jgi:hypothetical protein